EVSNAGYGDGGGTIKLTAGTKITVSGTITANGGTGRKGGTEQGGGGGGGGGQVFLTALEVDVSGGEISVNGGTGGEYGNNDGGGGGGGGGYISITYGPSYNAGTYSYSGGAAGVDGTQSTDSSTAGAAGSSAVAAGAVYITSGITTTSGISSGYTSTNWDVLTINKDVSGAGTALTVDVLKASDDSVLLTNVATGTDIGSAGVADTVNSIKLRANLSTSDSANTPKLLDWAVAYHNDPPNAPTLTSPANDVWTADTTPTFTWNFSDPESGDTQNAFTVQIDNDSGFGSVDYTSGDVTSGNEFWTPGSAIASGVWYWKVRNKDGNAQWGSYSGYWIVKVDAISPTQPAYISPADNSWQDPVTQSFQWNSASDGQSGIDKYLFEVSTKAKTDFSVIYYSSLTAATTVSVGSFADISEYYWRTKAIDNADNYSAGWSTYTVRVDTIAPVGMTISWIRADDENQITVEGTGTDAGSGLHADAWWFEETTGNPGATSSSVWESTSVYTDSGLSRNTQYTYKVRLRDAAGNVSGYSTPVTKWTLPAVWKENGTVRTGEKSFGTSSNSDWTWEIPVKGSQEVTVTAYIRYNDSYGSAALPKVILSNNGVNDSAQMSGGADVWEKVTVSGTPTADGVVLLRFLAYSTNPGAEVFVDDIEVTQ
ncbi:MAG: hypothetical protein JRE40_14855, partial [Deltaproteobacteria bacterium]|nr:hypothetical protein [Deltaproteobacteria bacterium]